jgi:hypothetical protein
MSKNIFELPLESDYAETYLIHLAENRPDFLRELMNNKQELVNIVTEKFQDAWKLRLMLEDQGLSKWEISEHVNALLAPPDDIAFCDVEIMEPEEVSHLLEELIEIQKIQYQNK